MRAEIEITGLGRFGEGVGRHAGLVVFVPGAVPGDRCIVEYGTDRRRMARGTLIEVSRKSPSRRSPPCPAFDRCGGCQLQHVHYAQQLRMKRQVVVDALERIGHLSAEVGECIPSTSPYGYRTKLSWPVQQGCEALRIGLYARGSHEIVEQDDCATAEGSLRRLPPLVRSEARRLGIAGDGGSNGLLRHVVARRSRAGEILVSLVARRPDPRLRALAERLCARVPEIVGVALNLHPEPGNRVLGPTTRLLVGRSEISEEILGLSFLVGPTSFFQINPGAAERLFSVALEFAGSPDSGGSALDLYTGVGVLALLLARKGYRAQGIEQDPTAIALARRNAERNRLVAQFEVGDAQEASLPADLELLTLDPPRGGAPELARRLAREGPPRVVYISCDPATLARDAALLHAGGYALCRVQPVDLFPQTVHVETVARFERPRGA